ncbi:MAG: DNA polymerase III subunit gamma/tau [Moraxella sp.]|nr:DNA polymerase III subunit gamma/tau [Moraxella sp.]
MSNTYQVLARKYRPKNFAELIGQTHVSHALANAIDTGRLHHAYLFTGTRGVGKTTIARILAKCLNCETGITSQPCGVCDTCVSVDNGRFIDLIEIDAASRTKVEDTRDLLENVPYAPTQGRYKVYLIDEVHMLSTHSFNALLKTLEEPPAHVKFILATTDPQKLPITIVSRCLQFVLRPLSQELLHTHLNKILQTEQIAFTDNALWQLAQSAKGSVRDALSLTDQAIAFGGGSLQDDTVAQMLGLVDSLNVLELIADIFADNRPKVAQHIERLRMQMVDAVAMLDRLVDSFHQLALVQILSDVPLDMNETQKQAFYQLAQTIPSDVLQLYYEISAKSRDSVRFASTPMQALEMGILRLLAFRPLGMSEIPVAPTTIAPTSVTPLPTASLLDTSSTQIPSAINTNIANRNVFSNNNDTTHDIADDITGNIDSTNSINNDIISDNSAADINENEQINNNVIDDKVIDSNTINSNKIQHEFMHNPHNEISNTIIDTNIHHTADESYPTDTQNDLLQDNINDGLIHSDSNNNQHQKNTPTDVISNDELINHNQNISEDLSQDFIQNITQNTENIHQVNSQISYDDINVTHSHETSELNEVYSVDYDTVNRVDDNHHIITHDTVNDNTISPLHSNDIGYINNNLDGNIHDTNIHNANSDNTNSNTSNDNTQIVTLTQPSALHTQLIPVESELIGQWNEAKWDYWVYQARLDYTLSADELAVASNSTVTGEIGGQSILQVHDDNNHQVQMSFIGIKMKFERQFGGELSLVLGNFHADSTPSGRQNIRTETALATAHHNLVQSPVVQMLSERGFLSDTPERSVSKVQILVERTA